MKIPLKKQYLTDDCLRIARMGLSYQGYWKPTKRECKNNCSNKFKECKHHKLYKTP